jgi:hypothetical protein
MTRQRTHVKALRLAETSDLAKAVNPYPFNNPGRRRSQIACATRPPPLLEKLQIRLVVGRAGTHDSHGDTETQRNVEKLVAAGVLTPHSESAAGKTYRAEDILQTTGDDATGQLYF